MTNLKSVLIYLLYFVLILNYTQCIPEDEFITREDSEALTETDENSETENEADEIDAPSEANEGEEDNNQDEEVVLDDDEIEPSEEEEEEETSNLTDAEIILALVNTARTENGLHELVLNDALNQAAFLHSEDMFNQNYFSHVGLNGSQFWERTEAAGYTGSPRGENIAGGQRTPEAVHNEWMESEGHRANILNTAVTEMGLGRSSTGNYWTQIFGVGRN